MAAHSPIFSGTAAIAAVACFLVMGVAWSFGRLVKVCRRVDAAMDRAHKALDKWCAK